MKFDWKAALLPVSFHHGTIMQTGITCKKIGCYMRDSTCTRLIVEDAKIFRSYDKHFWVSHVKKIEES